MRFKECKGDSCPKEFIKLRTGTFGMSFVELQIRRRNRQRVNSAQISLNNKKVIELKILGMHVDEINNDPSRQDTL